MTKKIGNASLLCYQARITQTNYHAPLDGYNPIIMAMQTQASTKPKVYRATNGLPKVQPNSVIAQIYASKNILYIGDICIATEVTDALRQAAYQTSMLYIG